MSDEAVTQEAHTHKGLHFGLVTALCIAIIVACIIVMIGYLLYLKNPNHKYDIERGGSNEQNQALSVEDDEADTTSPVDAQAAKRKIEYLEKEVNALSTMNRFDASDLSDQTLQLVPADQPSL